MKGVFAIVLLLWIVVVPATVLVSVTAYPRYAKWRKARAARRLDHRGNGWPSRRPV